MDEYSSGFDPEVKKYFRRIINSLSTGILWLMIVVGLGYSMELAIIGDSWRWYNYVYYTFFVLSFAGLLLVLYRIWKKDFQK